MTMEAFIAEYWPLLLVAFVWIAAMRQRAPVIHTTRTDVDLHGIEWELRRLCNLMEATLTSEQRAEYEKSKRLSVATATTCATDSLRATQIYDSIHRDI